MRKTVDQWGEIADTLDVQSMDLPFEEALEYEDLMHHIRDSCDHHHMGATEVDIDLDPRQHVLVEGAAS